jgi:transcriptional regulator with XRE-family HTH domain
VRTGVVVSIGEVLAAARHQAGLSVSDVSESTRIRASIIRDIERDDYSACGGDFYARGHIRAIASAVGTDPRPLIEDYDATHRAQELAAASDFAPYVPVRLRERHRVNWTLVLSLLVLLALGMAGYLLIQGGAGQVGAGQVGAGELARSHRHGRSSNEAADSGRRRSGVQAAGQDRALRPVSAAAFGPGGAGTGDDPQDAPLVIDASPHTPWHTDWYASAQFGGLQSGTGLLLDLGRPADVYSAELTLGFPKQTDLQLRAGDQPALHDLPVVAQATDAGGTVWLRLAVPVRARYLLIWLTRLPPDSTGTFLASVYGVRVYGVTTPAPAA